MKNIVDEDGEIIAKATDDHTLIGGHHRLAVAASLGKKCSGKIPANLCGLIPSSREVLIDIQLDAEATRCDWPGIWSSRITRMPAGSCT